MHGAICIQSRFLLPLKTCLYFCRNAIFLSREKSFRNDHVWLCMLYLLFCDCKLVVLKVLWCQDNASLLLLCSLLVNLMGLLFLGASRTKNNRYLCKGHFVGLIADHILYLEYFSIRLLKFILRGYFTDGNISIG